MIRWNKRYQGGVFFTVVLLIFMLSSTFLYLLADYKIEMREKNRMEQLYRMKTMETMATVHLKKQLEEDNEAFQQDFEKQGEFNYNIGTVKFKLSENKLELRTTTGKDYIRIVYIENFLMKPAEEVK